jgi:hypothetical protein
MKSDDHASGRVPSGNHSEAVRHQVVNAATDVLHGASAGDGAHDPRQIPAFSDQSAINLYLALLQDRLPVYARTVEALHDQVGRASVTENLLPVAHACIDFYDDVLGVKVSVLASPDQLLRLRRVLKDRGLGPHAAYETVAAYLDREQRLGRVRADVECTASAQLLIGACVNYAFTKLLMGEGPPQDLYTTSMVNGLRLTG